MYVCIFLFYSRIEKILNELHHMFITLLKIYNLHAYIINNNPYLCIGITFISNILPLRLFEVDHTKYKSINILHFAFLNMSFICK